MQCQQCGTCCKETEMLLSNRDINRIENEGYKKEYFIKKEKSGYRKLKNNHGYCVFYNQQTKKCKIYKNRPTGCRIYPVIYDEEKGITADTICTAKNTVTEKEKILKTKTIFNLLKKIDKEAKNNKK